MILSRLVKAPHRHIVFTIPEELRNLFKEHRKTCLNILFDSVKDTLNYTIHNFKKSEKYALGFISCLHTFGRDLKCNPHIHVLFCEYVSGISTSYRKVPIFFEQLRKSFQHMLLSKLEKHFGKIFLDLLKIKFILILNTVSMSMLKKIFLLMLKILVYILFVILVDQLLLNLELFTTTVKSLNFGMTDMKMVNVLLKLYQFLNSLN